MKILKKHKYKFLNIMLSIISIFTLFLGINKTYAYETNQLSYTIDLYSDSNFTNEITSQNVGVYNGILIDKTILQNDNIFLYFKMKNNTTYTKKYYFLINWGYWNGTDWDWSLSSKQINLNIYNNDKTIQQSNYTIGDISNNGNYLPYPYFNTFIGRNINTSDNNNYIYGSFKLINFTSSYNLFIQNIDVVSVEDIGISQYYDTYYSQIEENYNQLLSNYNDLQDNYDTLDNNYENLQTQYDLIQTRYNDLMLSYNALESDYDTLQANYRTLNNTAQTIQLQLDQKINELNTLNAELERLQSTRENIIQGGLYNALNGTTARYYNTTYTDLQTLDNTTPLLTETIQMNTYAWTAGSIQNIEDTIYYGWYDNTRLTERSIVRLTLNAPTQFNNLTFSRNDKNQNRYIYLIFNDNTSTSLTILDSGEYDTYNITWENTENKFINEILFDVEPGYDMIYNINPNDVAQIYENAYNKGYFDGSMEEYQSIKTKDNTIAQLQQQVLTLTQQYQDLQNRYNRLQNSNNTLYSMVITIADVPLNIFKQIFNFDILGINISTFVMSLISLIIVIWLIKKII